MNKMENHELSNRVKKVQNLLHDLGADACVITSSVNQFYLTNSVFDGYFYIQAEEEPLMFVRRPAGLENVHYIRKPEQITDFIIRLPKVVLMETGVMPYTTALRLQKALGMPEIIDVSGKMREIRSVKSEFEMEQMRANAKIQSEVYKQIPSLYRDGITDIEFQIEVERVMRLNGSIGIFRAYGERMEIFMGSVLAGDNADVASPYDFSMGGGGLSKILPIGASGVALKEGMTVMFDMAGNYTPYQSDMTRTFAIGKIPDIAYRAHQVSIEMSRWLEQNVKPGITCAEIYDYSLKTAVNNGLEANFMGNTQQVKFVGHGLGLEINEPPVLTPRSKEVLQKNMAFAYEPKFVFPKIGAVGIENTFIVTDSGLEKITICEENIIEL
ncbi:M24 family metallopeptidase [Bacteroides heparinolyticus]|uniref:M24 family metallopeptidase n=2 Tax=Prevotella heparinolytica TaxID=28113 RepID=UPI0035A18181